MQSLSDIIQPEDNAYRPPHVKYETPAGFDLMDIMAFAEHGQPYEYFHTLREKAPVAWWQHGGYGCCRFLVAVTL